MANKHFGNLADVFKHVALAEILAQQKPAEYWESHAGAPCYDEAPPPPPPALAGAIPVERRHGVHVFAGAAQRSEALAQSAYGRLLLRGAESGRDGGAGGGSPVLHIPGSPLLAMSLLPATVRRLLFCDVEAESLVAIRDLARQIRPAGASGGTDRVECIQDDGVMLLRGAGLTLSEQWTRSTLAFIDPYEADKPTDAGITPVELWCELGNRGIAAVLWFGFHDVAQRQKFDRYVIECLDRVRLLQRNAYVFEGHLGQRTGAGEETKGCPTLWGFGLLTINVSSQATGAADRALKAVQAAYAEAPLEGWGSGAWQYTFRRQ